MALSNLSKDKLLAIEDLSNSYSTLYKKDMVLINLLGKNLSVINLHTYIFISPMFLRIISSRTLFSDFNLSSLRDL